MFKKQATLILLIVFCQNAICENAMIHEFKESFTKYQELSAQEKWEASLPYAKKAFDVGEDLFGKSAKNTASLSYNYALNLLEAGKEKEAIKALERTLVIYKKVYGKDSEGLIPVLMDLGHTMSNRSSGYSPIPHYDRALLLVEKNYGKNSAEYGRRSAEAGEVLLQKAAAVEAGRYLYDGHRILENKFGELSLRAGYVALNAGKYELAAKNYEKAIIYLKKALLSFERISDSSNRLELTARGFMVKAYEKLGQGELATEHCLAIGKMTPFTPVQDYFPLVKIAPRYPATAQWSGVEGYVITEYEVDETGRVKSPRVIEREGPVSLENVSLKAVKKFRYAPRFENGEPVLTKGVKNQFTFKLY